jgi:hypothetical protein
VGLPIASRKYDREATEQVMHAAIRRAVDFSRITPRATLARVMPPRAGCAWQLSQGLLLNRGSKLTPMSPAIAGNGIQLS